MARGPFKPQSLYCCSPSSGSPGTFSQTSYNPLNDSSLKVYLKRTGTFSANIDGTGGTPAALAACGQWGDSSGLGNHFAAAANNATRPVVHLTSVLGLDSDGDNSGGGVNGDLMMGLSSLVMTGGFSLFVRMNSTNNTTNKGIMGRWGSSGVNQWAFLFNSIADSTNLEALIRNSTNSANFSATTPNDRSATNHVVGMAYEPSNSLVRVWNDATESTAAATSINAGTGNVALFSYSPASTDMVNLAANITDVLLFNREMTLAERNQVRSYLG